MNMTTRLTYKKCRRVTLTCSPWPSKGSSLKSFYRAPRQHTAISTPNTLLLPQFPCFSW